MKRARAANLPRSVYSNTGFIVAAVVAERATGSSYEALMRSEVFEPLGIGSVGFGTTGDGQPRGHRGGAPVRVDGQVVDSRVLTSTRPSSPAHG